MKWFSMNWKTKDDLPRVYDENYDVWVGVAVLTNGTRTQDNDFSFFGVCDTSHFRAEK